MSSADSEGGLSRCEARLSLIVFIGFSREAVFGQVLTNTSASCQLFVRLRTLYLTSTCHHP